MDCSEFRAEQVYLPYEDQQTKEEDQTMADAAMAGADKLLESVGEIVKPAEDAIKGVATSAMKSVASMVPAVKGVVARSTPKAATPKAATPKTTTPKTAATAATSRLSSAVKDVAQAATNGNGNHVEPAEES
jgi:phage-related protein